MAAAARLLRVKLSRLSLIFFNKSYPIVTSAARLILNGASGWRKLYLPPRKRIHWGVVLGTSGVLCGSVALCAISSGISGCTSSAWIHSPLVEVVWMSST